MDKPDDGDDVVRLSTTGRNPAVRDGHPFALNINLSADLNKLYSVFLEAYRLSQETLRTTLGPGDTR